MLYNVTLVSTVQQNESAIYVHVSPPFWISFPFRSLQRIKKSSLVAQSVKNLPAMWETWVRSLGWEDPPEEDMAAHSSILA